MSEEGIEKGLILAGKIVKVVFLSSAIFTVAYVKGFNDGNRAGKEFYMNQQNQL